MTGIERLRELAEDYISHSWSEVGKTRGMLIFEIADQIERERACDADTIENVRLIVGGIIDDMERHVSGVEVADDSPVARWARELRDALKSYTSDGRDTQNPSCADHADAADVTSEAPKVTRDPAEDVSMSAYDLLPADERDAIAWVRDHGGLDYVKTEWRSRVPRDRYEARRQRLLGHIAECETALGRRREIISRLTHRVSDLTRENAELRRRAMPEGCQWPRYESGEPVGFGDEVSRLGEVWRICLYRDGSFSLNFCAYSKGERVKRPSVLAADGEPLEVGQTVWDGKGNGPYRVERVSGDDVFIEGRDIPYCGGDFTHQRPVLDADGVPIKKGDTVYWLEHTASFTVVSPHETRDNAGRELECGHTVEVMRDGHELHMYVHPESLHHTKPEPPDSWERWRSDLESAALGYAQDAYHGLETSIDFDGFVRRCRALAERERGEA